MTPTPDRHIPPLVSMHEAADMLGMSKQAMHKMINAGRIPAARAGSAWVLRRVVVERHAGIDESALSKGQDQ